MKIFLVMIVLLFVTYSSANAENIVVSGAGSDAINGTYKKISSVEYTYYNTNNSTLYSLIYDDISESWYLSDLLSNLDYYSVYSESGELPLVGWGQSDGGALPNPGLTIENVKYYVDASQADDNGDGLTWGAAKKDFSTALSLVVSGDKIWVKSGTYKPQANNSFELKNGVEIYGGFDGSETLLSERDITANETILSGDLNSNNINDAGDCYHVVVSLVATNNETIFDGFTVSGGNAVGGFPEDNGGGINLSSNNNLLIKNCTIKNNHAKNYGGGICIASSTPEIINCIISNNSCDNWGAGIYSSGGKFINCTIVKNSSLAIGGGLYSMNPYPAIYFYNTIFWGNSATDANQFYFDGGAKNDGRAHFENCCYSNATNDIGDDSGLLLPTACITVDPLFVNFADNDFRVIGQSPCVETGDNTFNSELTDIRGLIRKLNTSGTTVDAIIDMGAYEYNFGVDPLPVELSMFNAEIANNKVTLLWTTASEQNNFGFEIQKAKNENNRTVEEFKTIGFIEGHGNSNSVNKYFFVDEYTSCGKYIYRLKQLDTDGNFEYSKTINVEIINPTEFVLNQNYPNPFNPSTKITFSIPKSEYVVLKLYDAIGNEINTLIQEEKEAGSYEIDFDATNKLASGIYFYKLNAGKFTSAKKMQLLK